MVILKLIAWRDRPEERDNDLYDILRIIERYFDYNYDEIVEHLIILFLRMTNWTNSKFQQEFWEEMLVNF